MSVSTTDDDETRDDRDLRILPSDGSDPHTRPLGLDTDDDLALQVSGRPGGEYRARLMLDGVPLDAAEGDGELLGTSVERLRFISRAARLAVGLPDVDASREEIVDALRVEMSATAGAVIDGRLVVADAETTALADKPESVVYDPEAETWTLTFAGETFDRRDYTFERVQVRISAEQWAGGDPLHSLPDSVETSIDDGGRIDPDRWATLRRIWTERATVGDAPDARHEITEDIIRDRGVLPGTRMDVSQFEAIAEEYDKIKWAWREGDGVTYRERPELHHAARELGLLEEFDDLEGDEVTVRSREYKGENLAR